MPWSRRSWGSVTDLAAPLGAGHRVLRRDRVGRHRHPRPDRARHAAVEHARQPGIESLDLGDTVASALGVAVCVDNDVRPRRSAPPLWRGSGSIAYLNLGTGVAAVDRDGAMTGLSRRSCRRALRRVPCAVWRGARGAAGQVGHISVDPAGPLCRCGDSADASRGPRRSARSPNDGATGRSSRWGTSSTPAESATRSRGRSAATRARSGGGGAEYRPRRMSRRSFSVAD